jgi:hypothetical protein
MGIMPLHAFIAESIIERYLIEAPTIICTVGGFRKKSHDGRKKCRDLVF